MEKKSNTLLMSCFCFEGRFGFRKLIKTLRAILLVVYWCITRYPKAQSINGPNIYYSTYIVGKESEDSIYLVGSFLAPASVLSVIDGDTTAERFDKVGILSLLP